MPLIPGLEPDGAGLAERHAFGAVGIARPADPARLGRLIVAAFQRAKFGAIIDLFDLCDPRLPGAQSVNDQLATAYVELASGDTAAGGQVTEPLAEHAALTLEGRRFVAEMR